MAAEKGEARRTRKRKRKEERKEHDNESWWDKLGQTERKRSNQSRL